MLLTKLLYTQTVDADLFRMVKESDVKAFEELYNRYWLSLVNATYKRLNSHEKAEDIVQNIFIDLYKRRDEIELNTSLKAYLYQALKFKIFNEYRAELVRTRYQKMLFFRQGCEIDFADPLEAKELETKIDAVLDGLPQRCKQVFLLSRKDNLSYRDISAGLNITVSSVEKHISKALKTLRGQIPFS